MNIADLLGQDGVLVLERQKDKLSLLTLMAEHAGRALQLDANKITDAVLNREDLGSTGLGSGVAIPHARIAEVPYTLGVLALLREPLDYDAIDDEPVDIVFMLIMPATPAALEALACVARTFRQQDLAYALRQVGTAPEAYGIISKFSVSTPVRGDVEISGRPGSPRS